MGATCNRMLPRAVDAALSPAAPVVMFGIGREGVMNGGGALVVTFDGSGAALTGVPITTGVLTLTVSYRATPTSGWSEAVAAGSVTAGKIGQVEISPPQTGNYEVRILGVMSVGVVAVAVSSLTTKTSASVSSERPRAARSRFAV